jgi:predicted nucleic acid-binding protein
MSAADAFLDTNVILYLLSADHHKADMAEALVASGGVVSVQVLNEAAAVARRKRLLSLSEIREWLAAVRAPLPRGLLDRRRARRCIASVRALRTLVLRRFDRGQPPCPAVRVRC